MSHTNQIPKASSIKAILWAGGIVAGLISALAAWYTLKGKIRDEYSTPTTQTSMTLYDLDRLDGRYESKELASERYKTVIGRLDDIKTTQANQQETLNRLLEHCERDKMARRISP